MIDLIEHNPAFKKPVLTVLSTCKQSEGIAHAQLVAQAEEAWDEGYRYDAAAVTDALIRKGALAEELLMNGEPYDGTLQDMQLDANVPDDATVESRVAVTDEGLELLQHYAPEATMQAILAEKPHYRDVFEAVLSTCNTEEGCARDVLEAVINEFPQLKPNPETHQTTLYAQYFIDTLETAGGIAWQGAWRTTDAGRAALAG